MVGQACRACNAYLIPAWYPFSDAGRGSDPQFLDRFLSHLSQSYGRRVVMKRVTFGEPDHILPWQENRTGRSSSFRMFRLNTEEYPADRSVFDSYGEACMKAKMKELAIKSYERARARSHAEKSEKHTATA